MVCPGDHLVIDALGAVGHLGQRRIRTGQGLLDQRGQGGDGLGPLRQEMCIRDRSLPLGRPEMNMEMSVRRTLRPSSARTLTAVASVMTSSRPSPAMWL